MTYNLFLVDSCDPGVMAEALAAAFRVPVREVDVADADGDQDDRNWEALVSCEYSHVPGNVSLSLDIYAQDSVGQQPPESEFSAAFARRIGTPVLYPPQESAMSAHWLVTPEGLTTRARLSESDDDEPTFTVTAVEALVDRLPDVPVMHLPEVVREQKIATPLADSFAESLQPLKETATPRMVRPSQLRLPRWRGSPSHTWGRGKSYLDAQRATGSHLVGTPWSSTGKCSDTAMTSRGICANSRRTWPRCTSATSTRLTASIRS